MERFQTNAKSVHRPPMETQKIRDFMSHEYHRILHESETGVDMRGKTGKPVKYHILGGVGHHLDNVSFDYLLKFIAKRRPTLLMKQLMENGKFEECFSVYGIPLTDKKN